jgi:hypothetical protein
LRMHPVRRTGVDAVHSIAKAASEAHTRWLDWRTSAQATARRRDALRATDALIATIEEINLAGRGRETGALVAEEIRGLEMTLGRSVPPTVAKAPTWIKLHAALLDWQEDLLNDACPLRQSTRYDDDLFAGLGFRLTPIKQR